MSEREEVLREFTRTVEHCEFASDDVLDERAMADEIVRLRSQLAAVQSECEVLRGFKERQEQRAAWEYHQSLINYAQRAERERDEARRERDAIRGQYAMSLEEQVELVRQREETSSQLWDCMNERDGWKHRAERAERVVEAAREPSEELVLQAAAVFGGHRNFYGTEEQIDMVIRAAIRALDAAEGDAMTQDELKRLEGLASAATGGPWEVGDPYNGRSMALVAVYGMGMEVADTQKEADAAFIAAARDAVPALVAEVRRLRGLVREAFNEGFAIGWDDPGNRDYWPESLVRKTLEGE